MRNFETALDTSHPPREDIPTDSTALIAQIIQAIGGSPGLTHITWGRRVWQLATPIQQQALIKTNHLEWFPNLPVPALELPLGRWSMLPSRPGEF